MMLSWKRNVFVYFYTISPFKNRVCFRPKETGILILEEQRGKCMLKMMVDRHISLTFFFIFQKYIKKIIPIDLKDVF